MQLHKTDALRAFLKTDELRYVTPLKMLGLFGDALAAHRVSFLDAHGYILTMPRALSQWASSKYPDAERAVFTALPAIASDELIEGAVRCVLRITEQKSFVVNTVDTSLIARLQRANDDRLPLSMRLALLTFTPTNELSHTSDAAINDQSMRCFAHIPPDARSLLKTQNSYSESELATIFTDGTARCWLRYVDESPVAVLITMTNSPSLHEIGSLHVRADARRAGHAQMLVRAALADLRKRGLKARYVVEANNTASIALAEQSGLRLTFRAEHWVSRRGP
jgi:ribosomal protein S18 acetylase RimI-like enzyme